LTGVVLSSGLASKLGSAVSPPWEKRKCRSRRF